MQRGEPRLQRDEALDHESLRDPVHTRELEHCPQLRNTRLEAGDAVVLVIALRCSVIFFLLASGEFSTGEKGEPYRRETSG